MKIKKVLLSAILVLVAITLTLSTKVYAAAGSWKLGVEQIREGITTKNSAETHTTRYSYKVNTKRVLKIVDKTTGTANFNNAIYCLKAGQGFGSVDSAMSDVVYNTYYDMVREKSSVNGILGLSDSNYGSILWLLDNMYLPKQTPIAKRQAIRNSLLTNMLASLDDPDSILDGFELSDLNLTDDDIEVVQQWALWYFTNPNASDSYHTENLPEIQVSTTGGTALHTALSGEGNLIGQHKEGEFRQEEAKLLYKYLITQAKANSNYTKVPTQISLNRTLTPVAKQVSSGVNKNYVIGPFEIVKTGNTLYSFDGKVVDVKTGAELTYTICNANGSSISGVRTLSEAVGKGQFYIQISKSNLTAQNIKDIKLDINYMTNDTISTFWTVSGSTVDQPVVVIERTPKEESQNITVHIPEFDLVLRKYITGVTRNGVTVSIDELTGRTPVVDSTNLKTSTNGKTATTAEYKHRKDPVPVQTGDIVNYKITIYNEGEIAGRATKVVDYLPEGLRFNSATSTDYNFTPSSDGRTITITAKNSDNLAAYNGVKPQSKDIVFSCVVTKKEDKQAESTILTNIAEITEAYDVYNAKMEQIGDDRDSEPQNASIPTDANLPGYKGNSSNKSDLTDKNYHYKGQQDDDDFEKLKVTTPEFDLALRKFITQIDGKDIDTSRAPVVDTTPLKNAKGTTAIYKHPKDPLVVKIGGKVTYTIRIYNEADVAGYVTVVEDYLPEELELVPESESAINAKYHWNVVGRVATTNYLNGKVLDAYDGGNTLDYEDVQIECRIKSDAEYGKVLTNVAQINGDSGDDRDSQPGNLIHPSDTDLPNYKGKDSNKDDLTDRNYHYEGQQDDDDFEKVITYTPGFDLSLRKFITHIDNEEVEISRVPVVDTTPLKDESDTTAIYKHPKNPLVVKTGSVVKYTIRVYNEGEGDGKVTQIEDYLPEELEIISTTESEINRTYNWYVVSGTNGRVITTDYLKDEVISGYDGGDTLDYRDVEIECRVKENAKYGKVATNIAQINEDTVNDRDSTPNNVVKPDDANLPNYKGKDTNKSDLSDKDYYYKGQQDDDDFEKIEIYKPEYDLALRKFITHIQGEEVETSRVPEVDTTPLKNGETTAKYTHPKNPLTVNIGDTVRYAIRVYNEAKDEGRVIKIEDYLPEELELVPKSESTINNTYGWVEVEGTNGRVITTDYLKDEVIAGFDGGDTLDYRDVEVECRVKDTANAGKILTNIAQINGDTIDDRDSTPDNVTKPTDEDLPNYEDHQEDDDDYEKVVVYKPTYDLALRKFITHIQGEEVEVSRVPVVDTTPLKSGETTAKYTHPKNPLIVHIGDTIRYTIRVYNEGDQEAKVTVIEDYLPEELEVVPASESEINEKYGWQVAGRVITTDYLKDEVLAGFDGGNTLDYRDVEIECKVKQTENTGKILTNIAQINGDTIDDRDSTPQNVEKPTDENLPNYEDHQEDDDDYEKVKIYQPEYDLALRKFITEVNGKAPEVSRVPVVDTTPLENGKTTAKYTHPKDPVLVKTGDIVVYTIRVYNEGKYDGYAEEVKDNIPEGLEYIIDNEVNIEYRWKLSADQKQVSTDYLSKARDEDNVIKAFDSATMDTLDYKDVKIAFKVVEPNTSTRILTNIAEIKQDDGKDIDSTPDNDVPGEDDIDEEHVKLRYFDLALRKFITKVESKTGEKLPVETDNTTDVSREPKVEIDKETGKIKYIHPKDPVIVANSDVVIYTLRVYNEGTIDGYAEEIKDDVPDGLELVPEHAVNVKYGWIMYDKDGKVTEDVTKAKTIRTTYLSEANGEENIIKAFDKDTMSVPDYKEVQVAFKVVEKNAASDRIVINTAEISKDSDDDVDSTPDNDVPDEDDIDKEYIKLKYFDLSLLKWVSKMMVTENGKTKVIETGYNGLENPEPVVKYEVKKSQVKSIVIKYEYGIKITNEGQIAGYAKEIADYIPEGLEFIPEDNPLWTLKENGKIVTTQLENTLLQPGESKIVTVIFKWKNGNDNFGEKENWAEISKDYNEKDAEDIDSTPDNFIKGEDDIDRALVILNPKTGQTVIYIVLPTIVLAVLSTGIVLIKKYVL